MKLQYCFAIRTMSLLTVVLMATSLYSQEESILYLGINGKVTSADQAIQMQKTTVLDKYCTVNNFVRKDSTWEKVYSEQSKKLNDSTYRIKGSGENHLGTTIRTFKRKSEGTWQFTDAVNSQVGRTGTCQSLFPLVLHGEVTEYFPNGNKKSVSTYKNNELLSNMNWLENGDQYIDNIFYSVDSEPTFNPGMKVLHQHILKGFEDAGINTSSVSGSLIIGFVVMEDGNIGGIRIVQGLGTNVNEAVYNSFMTLPLMGKWTPARLNGHPVRSFQIFPINFINDENNAFHFSLPHNHMDRNFKP